jgi:Mg-chelatase subunit ChlD
MSFGPGGRAYGPDLLGLVGFNSAALTLVPPCSVFDGRLQEAVGKLPTHVGGRTNLAGGLRESIKLLNQMPKGFLRRCWLLSDGEANVEKEAIPAAIAEARAAWVNVNCVGFGDAYDRPTLEAVAAGTHRGRFVEVHGLRALTDALLADQRPPRSNGRRQHRVECTVLALDLSGSMSEPMEGRKKIEVVQEAVGRLLAFKQHCFS